MNLWIRIFACFDGEMETSPTGITIGAPCLSITVYPAEEPARGAMKKHGGLVLSVTSESIKPLLKAGPVHCENGEVKQLATGYLARAEDFDDEDSGFFQDGVYVCIDYSTLPHTHTTEIINEGEDNEYACTCPVFAPEAMAWIDRVEAELNVRFMP